MSGCDGRLDAAGLPTQRDGPGPRGTRERDRPPRARAREHLRTGAWLLFLAGIAGMVTGMVLPNGLLLAVGLVMAGAVGQSVGSRGSRRPS